MTSAPVNLRAGRSSEPRRRAEDWPAGQRGLARGSQTTAKQRPVPNPAPGQGWAPGAVALPKPLCSLYVHQFPSSARWHCPHAPETILGPCTCLGLWGNCHNPRPQAQGLCGSSRTAAGQQAVGRRGAHTTRPGSSSGKGLALGPSQYTLGTQGDAGSRSGSWRLSQPLHCLMPRSGHRGSGRSTTELPGPVPTPHSTTHPPGTAPRPHSGLRPLVLAQTPCCPRTGQASPCQAPSRGQLQARGAAAAAPSPRSGEDKLWLLPET